MTDPKWPEGSEAIRDADGLRVVIVTNEGSAAPGGMASVVRHVRAHLPMEVVVTELASSADGAPRRPRGLIHSSVAEVAGPVGAITVRPCSLPGALALRLAHRLRYYPRTSWTLPHLAWLAERGTLQQTIGRDTDIVHILGTGFDGLGPAAAHAARRVNARVTILPGIHPGTWGDGRLDAKFYRTADTIFCLSEHEQQVVVGLGVARDQTVICPLGPFDGPFGDAERFRARWELDGRQIVLFMARRDEYKGLRVLVDSFAAIRAAVPTAALVVVGPPGDGQPIVVDPDFGVDLGTASSSDAADALASADVVCVPSSGESFGILVLDAWSRGIPVVVGPSPASRELVRFGGGIAVEQTADDIAEAVKHLLLNPTQARAMGRAGQSLQRSTYTWDRTVAVHLGAWAALARSRRSSCR